MALMYLHLTTLQKASKNKISIIKTKINKNIIRIYGAIVKSIIFLLSPLPKSYKTIPISL